MKLHDLMNEYALLTQSTYSKATYELHGYFARELLKAFSKIKVSDASLLTLNDGYKVLNYFKSQNTKSNDTINKIILYMKKILLYHKIYVWIDLPKLKIKTNHFQRFYHDDLKMIVRYLMALNANKNSLCYKTAIFLMIDSGCRISELLSIKRKNIDFRSFPMRIYIETTKNKKPRFVPFSEFSKSYVVNLLDYHSHDLLFWNFKYDIPMTKSCIRSFYRYMQKKLCFDSIHSHRFRKTFASILAENGMSLYDLQLLLDHSRISTTQIYVQSKQDRGLNSYVDYNDWGVN